MPATTSLVVTALGPPAGTVLSMSTATFLGRQLKTRVSVCTDTKHRNAAVQIRCQGSLVVMSLYGKSCMHVQGNT